MRQLKLRRNFDQSIFIQLSVCVLSCFSRVWLFVTLWTLAHQAPLSVGFSRQEYWDGLPCPSPGHLPDPGLKPHLLSILHWQTVSWPVVSYQKRIRILWSVGMLLSAYITKIYPVLCTFNKWCFQKWSRSVVSNS